MKRTIPLLLALALLLGGCGSEPASQIQDSTPPTVTPGEPRDASAELSQFGLSLLQSNLPQGENSLLSPLSVLAALGMAANGAQGNTLDQLEAVMGLPVGELNDYLYACMANQDGTLRLANSLWIRDQEGFTADPAFLDTCAGYYQAEIFQGGFDRATCDQINGWVKEQTGGLIPKILDQVPDNAMMYLINALAFDGQWETSYSSSQIRSGAFTAEDGTVQTVTMLHCQEQLYLADGQARGFLKPYAGGRYAFAALLPNEGVSMEDYVRSLTGAQLVALLSEPQSIPVNTAIPKFEVSWSGDLSKTLADMGAADAFSPEQADFSGMAQDGGQELYLSRLLHKTVLRLDERGTRAAAVTAAEGANCTSINPSEPRQVILDRPFLYMLVDLQENIPVFLGVMMTP